MWNGAPVVPPPGPVPPEADEPDEAGREDVAAAEGVEGSADEHVGESGERRDEAAVAPLTGAPPVPQDPGDEPSDEDAAPLPTRRGTLPLRPRVLHPQPRTAPTGDDTRAAPAPGGESPTGAGATSPQADRGEPAARMEDARLEATRAEDVEDARVERADVEAAGAETPATGTPVTGAPATGAPATGAPAEDVPPTGTPDGGAAEAPQPTQGASEGRRLRPSGRRLAPSSAAFAPGLAPRLRPRRPTAPAGEGQPSSAAETAEPATPEVSDGAAVASRDTEAPTAQERQAPQEQQGPQQQGTHALRSPQFPSSPQFPQAPSAPAEAGAGASATGDRLFDAAPAPAGTGSNGHTRNGGGGPGRAVPERLPMRAGTPRRERTPIYDEVASAWFREAPSAGGPDDAEWASTSGDEGWRAAAATADALDAGVSAGGTTEAGLPRRRPRAQLVPGAARSAGSTAPGEGPGGPTAGPRRSAEAIRGRLASYQQGVAEGRTTRRPRPAESVGEPPRGDRPGEEEEQ